MCVATKRQSDGFQVSTDFWNWLQKNHCKREHVVQLPTILKLKFRGPVCTHEMITQQQQPHSLKDPVLINTTGEAATYNRELLRGCVSSKNFTTFA